MKLHEYQQQAVDELTDMPKANLFAGMGLGKTVMALTYCADMLDTFEVNKILVLAPVRVAKSVWKQEAAAWPHLRHLKIGVCLNNNRDKMLHDDSFDIYVASIHSITQIINVHEDRWKWDMLVIDESSLLKSHRTKRFKTLRKALKNFSRLLLLTGTPVTNSLRDIWSQVFLIDEGERLGKSYIMFEGEYFIQNPYNRYDITPKTGSLEKIQAAIRDVCVNITPDNYFDMPEKIEKSEFCDTPEELFAQYKDFAETAVLSLLTENVVAVNAGVLANKLLQFCSGAVYIETGEYRRLHDYKLNLLQEIVESFSHEPIIIAYNYKHELARIRKLLPTAVLLKGQNEIDAWNNGEIPILVCHPRSCGYGVNLQKGGSVLIWYTLPWSLELYDQMIARIYRQGQKHTTRVVKLLMPGTIDERVLSTLSNKSKLQQNFIKHLKTDLNINL